MNEEMELKFNELHALMAKSGKKYILLAAMYTSDTLDTVSYHTLFALDSAKRRHWDSTEVLDVIVTALENQAKYRR